LLVSYKEGLKFARVLHKKLGERFMEQRIITVEKIRKGVETAFSMIVAKLGKEQQVLLLN